MVIEKKPETNIKIRVNKKQLKQAKDSNIWVPIHQIGSSLKQNEL